MPLIVLRLGHRVERDKRVTTHVCLAARALGASGVVLSGEKDLKVVESVRKVVENWGGKFSVRHNANWKAEIKKAKKNGFKVVHLTMYGEPLQSAIGKARKARKVLVVVGAEKVPPDAYELADYNVSVASQPHSEISALALFLHEFFRGKELSKRFPGAKRRITPQSKGKKVLRLSS